MQNSRQHRSSLFVVRNLLSIRTNYEPNSVSLVVLLLLSSVFCLLSPGLMLYAQGPDIRRDSAFKDDLNFAEKLAEQAPTIRGRGWEACLELAEEFAQSIQDRVTSKELKTQAVFTLIKIKRQRAQAERDPEKRRTLEDKVINLLEAFIETVSPDDPKSHDAQFEIGGLLQDKALALKDDFRKAIDPEEEQRLKTETENAFSSAAQYFKKLTVTYEELLDKENDSERRKDLEISLVNALHRLPLTLYYHSQLYDKSEERKQELLKETVNLFNTFILTYGELLIAYDAAVWCGLAYYELGKYEQAEGFFEVASAGLVSTIRSDPDPKNQERWFEDAQQIIQKGFYHKAWLYNITKDYNLAIQAVDELLKLYPDDQDDNLMRLALLEKARAYLKLRDSSRALEIIQEINISKTPPSPEVRKVIDELLSGLPNDTLPFSVRLTNIQNLVEAGRYRQAVPRAQGLFVDLVRASKEDRFKYTPRVLLFLGDALREQKAARLYEAVIAYETAYKKYGEVLDDQGDKIGPQAVSRAAEAWFLISAKTGEKDDRQRYNKALEYLSKKWPKSDEAKETYYFQGREHEARKEYEKAAENYAEVRPDSKYYLHTLARVGYMYYLQARTKTWRQYEKETAPQVKTKLKEQTNRLFNKAETWFAKYDTHVQENINDPRIGDQTKRKMIIYLAEIRLYWARIYLHEAVQKYNRTLEILKDFETEFAANPKAVASALALKIEALANSDDLNRAVSYLSTLMGHCNKNRLVVPSAPVQLLALVFESKANKILSDAPPVKDHEQRIAFIKEIKQSAPDKYKAYESNIGQSRKYLWFWFTMKKKAGVERIRAKEVLIVADKLYLSAEELDKREFYDQAAELYQGLIEKKFAKIPRLKLPQGRQPWHLVWTLAQCYTHLNKWPEAVELLGKLEVEQQGQGAVIKAVAIAYQNFACQSNIAQKDKIKYLGEANKRWLQIARGVEEYSQMYWEARYEMCHNIFKGGQYQEALESIEAIERQISPEFGGGYRDKFLGLKRQIKDILPK